VKSLAGGYKALPAPDPVHAKLGQQYVAPRNDVEERLAAIWAEVLELEQVGVHSAHSPAGGSGELSF